MDNINYSVTERNTDVIRLASQQLGQEQWERNVGWGEELTSPLSHFFLFLFSLINWKSLPRRPTSHSYKVLWLKRVFWLSFRAKGWRTIRFLILQNYFVLIYRYIDILIHSPSKDIDHVHGQNNDFFPQYPNQIIKLPTQLDTPF